MNKFLEISHNDQRTVIANKSTDFNVIFGAFATPPKRKRCDLTLIRAGTFAIYDGLIELNNLYIRFERIKETK